MSSITENKDEYLCSLRKLIADSARDMGLALASSSASDAYLFKYEYATESGTVVTINQYISVEDLPYKIVPALRDTGGERFNINPEDWYLGDDGLNHATKIIHFAPSANGAKYGNIIRLINEDRIPTGMTNITIYNNIIEFTANPYKLDISAPTSILLKRFAFVHITDGLYDIKGLNINELIGRAKNNII